MRAALKQREKSSPPLSSRDLCLGTCPPAQCSQAAVASVPRVLRLGQEPTGETVAGLWDGRRPGGFGTCGGWCRDTRSLLAPGREKLVLALEPWKLHSWPSSPFRGGGIWPSGSLVSLGSAGWPATVLSCQWRLCPTRAGPWSLCPQPTCVLLGAAPAGLQGPSSRRNLQFPSSQGPPVFRGEHAVRGPGDPLVLCCPRGPSWWL